jgi:hypothetical protein
MAEAAAVAALPLAPVFVADAGLAGVIAGCEFAALATGAWPEVPALVPEPASGSASASAPALALPFASAPSSAPSAAVATLEVVLAGAAPAVAGAAAGLLSVAFAAAALAEGLADLADVAAVADVPEVAGRVAAEGAGVARAAGAAALPGVVPPASTAANGLPSPAVLDAAGTAPRADTAAAEPVAVGALALTGCSAGAARVRPAHAARDGPRRFCLRCAPDP